MSLRIDADQILESHKKRSEKKDAEEKEKNEVYERNYKDYREVVIKHFGEIGLQEQIQKQIEESGSYIIRFDLEHRIPDTLMSRFCTDIGKEFNDRFSNKTVTFSFIPFPFMIKIQVFE